MSKKMKIALSLFLAVIIALAFAAGCLIGGETSPQNDFDIVEQAWEIILRDYVENDQIDTEALAQGAVRGMVEALGDPYTSYLDAEDYQLGLKSLEGSFEGVGAYVTIKDEQLMIIAPIADSPADKAGIRAGDIVLEIDGQSTTGMSLVEAVLLVQGPEGTQVDLLVLHEGETEPELISIIRAVIEVPSVEFEMREEFAYIVITNFSERTAEELLTVIETINQQGAEGIILDLRGNPGGLLETVVDVAGFFLREGVVVDVVDSKGNHDVYSVRPGGITTDLPMVVLVDEYSASGSEVLAGALQDYGRAVIAGTTTFGKGSVDILRRLGDGSGLYITNARWLTPKGRLIEGEGIYPDYELELEGEDAIQWAIDYLRSN
ncbi:MAG: S41 family peptidase [Dehalococcoidales bacterium]|jgi:carboxyl-terminal processing protease|nr:S41 family peptidase [Dehalococcoidales bacterium]